MHHQCKSWRLYGLWVLYKPLLCIFVVRVRREWARYGYWETGSSHLKRKKVFDDLKNIRSFRPSCALQTQCRLRRIGDRTSGLGGIINYKINAVMFVWINWTYRCLKQLISSRCVKLSLRIYVHRLRNLAFQNKYKITVISLTHIPPFFLKTDRYDHFFLADWPSLTRIRWLERVTENATFENAPQSKKL